MSLEATRRPYPGMGQILKDFTPINLVNAIIAFIFAASGPVAIILAVGARGGLSESDLSSWIFGCFFFNGIVSIVFSVLYRQPLVFFWTIPGTVLLGPSLEHLSFEQAIGAYYATAALMAVIGLTGWAKRAMEILPMPIIMAMVAGVFLQFGIDWIRAFVDDFMITAVMTAAFVLFSAFGALGRRLPPLIATLIVGVAIVLATGGFAVKEPLTFALPSPNVYVPAFSWTAMIELVLPLAISVLAIQNAQGYAVLKAAGHEPPLNTAAVVCGVTSAFGAVIGTISTCLTGPVSAILSSGGTRESQYTGAILVGVFALFFALLAPVFTTVMLAAPAAFIATLAGIAMLKVLESAFIVAFKGNFTLSALVTFLITVAGVSIFNISAPFWGLVFGFLTALLLERGGFGRQSADKQADKQQETGETP